MEACGLLGSGRSHMWLLCGTLGLHLPPWASLLAAEPAPLCWAALLAFCPPPAGSAVSCVPLRLQLSVDAGEDQVEGSQCFKDAASSLTSLGGFLDPCFIIYCC